MRISTRPGHEKNGTHQDQAIGRSRGGLTTKIHACVDALGNPIRLILTAGQVADVTQGAALIERFEAGAVIADKGYDSDSLIQTIEGAGLKPSSRRAATARPRARLIGTTTRPEISLNGSSTASSNYDVWQRAMTSWSHASMHSRNSLVPISG
nr:transposase [Zoogloea sp. LCSB751]